MQFPSLMTLLALVAIGAQVLSINSMRKLQRSAPELRSKAMLQFRECKLHANEERYCFQGNAATIVRQHEFGPIRGLLSKKSEYMSTVYATNDFGEYFVFKSSTEGCCVKHLSTTIARVIFKEEYVAPSIGV